ncbi:MAG: translation initiation factor IF-2 [Deltaproteobacteria bacterium]|nr:translation initiation factor IF-2 [Deltaproteobacteria bacterium]
MAGKRISTLAKEWSTGPHKFEVKDLLAHLERLGIHGKRPQNSLSDEEVDQLRAACFGEKPVIAVGEERTVTSDEGQTSVERRVSTRVIRRRAAPVQPALPEEAPAAPAEPLITHAEVIETFSEPFATEPFVEPELPVHIEPSLPPVAPAPTPPLELRPVAPAPPAAVVKPAPKPAPPPVASAKPQAMPAARAGAAPAMPEAQRGPRVLGRIDLKKAEPPKPAPRAERERPAAAVQPPAALFPPEETAEAGGRGRKKKRRVIQKPETAPEVLGGRDTRYGKLPRKKRAQPGKEQRKTEITTPKASKRVVRISEIITVGDLAKAMGVKAGEVIKKLMDAGMMATINQVLDADTASLIATEFEYNVENVAFNAESAIEVDREATTEDLPKVPRPPVVTIMGHVDHGKTSLLDRIRQTNVTAQEAGGITQHIGAYSVEVHNKRVAFLDTPGHEAFTQMRARGAKVTDIVILVVAADDGVMPQTVEALNHARAAAVPVIVAINKIDKPEADLDRIRRDLANHGLVPEDWGGDTVCVPVSAKTGDGIPQLLEMLLLQAEMLELQAPLEALARGTIVEAKLDRGRGPVATVLVQEGTLKIGDPFVCGGEYGRLRAMIDDKGRKLNSAGPSTPVEILGLNGVPDAGNAFVVVKDEATARQVADHRRQKQREADLVKSAKVSLEDLYEQIQQGEVKELRVVMKADVQGSVEALSEALSRLSSEEVRLNVLHASVGGITESDVLLASASNAVIIGFNVRPESKAADLAEREGVDQRLYTVIYNAVNDVRDAMEGLLEPTFREKTVGRAQVREVFAIPSIGAVAGCHVSEGKLTRGAAARLVRDHVVVHTGKVATLRRFKEDVREVQSGYECGLTLENYQDVKVGDVVEAYESEAVTRRLTPTAGRAVAAERRV